MMTRLPPALSSFSSSAAISVAFRRSLLRRTEISIGRSKLMYPLGWSSLGRNRTSFSNILKRLGGKTNCRGAGLMAFIVSFDKIFSPKILVEI